MARLNKQGQLIHDVTVKFQLYLERLKTSESRKIDSAIRGVDRAVRNAMESLGPGPSRTKLNRQLRKLREQMEAISEQQVQSQLKSLRKFSDYALEFHTDTVNLITPPNMPALSPSKSASWAGVLSAPIQATGTQLEPFVRSWSNKMIERVEGAINVGFAQGLTTDEIVRRIRGTKASGFTDGILGGVTKREANAMVRTSLQHVNSQAQQMMYDDNADIIEGYYWISTLDNRTSSQCRSLDGQMFETGKGPVPPIHVNCRSTTIPKVRGVDLLGNTTRASADGPVPADMTYYEWLQKQSPEFQDDVLGKARGKVFREGGMTAEEFSRANVSSNYEPLTLEEMKEKIAADPSLPTSAAAAPSATTDFTVLTQPSTWDEAWETANKVVNNGVDADSLTYGRYIGNSSISSRLRGDYDTWYRVEDSMADVRAITADLEAAHLHQPLTLFRGLNEGVLDNLKVGDLFMDDAFMSTSIYRSSSFIQETTRQGGHLMTIKAPKGTKGRYITSKFSDEFYATEHEVLLQRGSRLRVEEVIRHRNYTEYVMTYVDSRPDLYDFASRITKMSSEELNNVISSYYQDMVAKGGDRNALLAEFRSYNFVQMSKEEKLRFIQNLGWNPFNP